VHHIEAFSTNQLAHGHHRRRQLDRVVEGQAEGDVAGARAFDVALQSAPGRADPDLVATLVELGDETHEIGLDSADRQGVREEEDLHRRRLRHSSNYSGLGASPSRLRAEVGALDERIERAIQPRPETARPERGRRSAARDAGIEDAVRELGAEGRDPQTRRGELVAARPATPLDEPVPGQAPEVVGHARPGVLLKRKAEERGDGSPELGVAKARGQVGKRDQCPKERHDPRIAEAQRGDAAALVVAAQQDELGELGARKAGQLGAVLHLQGH